MTHRSYIIGRAGDILLYDNTVSRRHARLDVDGAEFHLEDLDSRNGTFEIRDKQLVPIMRQRVSLDQVFAFGECVRSMTQLLGAAAGDEMAAAGLVSQLSPDPNDATVHALGVAAVQRLSAADIVSLLERAEEKASAGVALPQVCAALGISQQRYQRWCREYGGTRREREHKMQALRRENERLRKRVADISLERDALREALAGARARPRGGLLVPPNLTVVGADNKNGKS